MDAYAGYDAVFGTKDAVREVACWAHVRRKFFDAQATSAEKSLVMLALIGELYGVERQAKKESDALGEEGEVLHARRWTLRQEHSRRVLQRIKEKLDAWFEDASFEGALPKSPLGKAVRYALNNWQALERYLESGELNIDNNPVERAAQAGRRSPELDVLRQ